MKMMTMAKVKVAAVVLLVAGAGVGVVAEVGVSSQAEHTEHARSAATQAVPAPSLDADSIQKLMTAMSQQERLDYLIRALKQREAELQQVSISFTEFLGNTRNAVGRANKNWRSLIQTDLTIDGPRRLIRSQEWNEDKVLLQDSLISFNAGRRRALTNIYYVKVPPSGTIVDDPEFKAMTSPFYHMLGNRVKNGYRIVGGRPVEAAVPISEALSQLPWDVQLSQEDGVPVVTATFKKAGEAGGPSDKTIWDYVWTFDLSKNWMPKRYIDRTVTGPAKIYKLNEVTEARNVEGLFLPWKTTFRYSLDSSEGKSSGDGSIEVTGAARGKRLDDGFEVVFPPGTQVIDDIAGVAYRVREDGGADPMSYMNREGKVIEAKER